MTDVEDRLMQATQETKSNVATMDLHSIDEAGSRNRTSRLVASAGAFALMIAAVGVTALLVTGDPEPVATEFGAGSDNPVTTTAPNTDGLVEADTASTTLPPAEPENSLAPIPHLGLEQAGWVAVETVESDGGYTIVYQHETDGPSASIQVWQDTKGSPNGSGYAYAVEGLVQEANRLEDVELSSGDSAAAFDFSDPNTGNTGFAFVWQATPDVSVELLAYVDSFDAAVELAESVRQLSDWEWDDYVNPVDPDSVDLIVTTTTIVGP